MINIVTSSKPTQTTQSEMVNKLDQNFIKDIVKESNDLSINQSDFNFAQYGAFSSWNNFQQRTTRGLTRGEFQYPTKTLYDQIINFEPRYKGISGKKPTKHSVLNNLHQGDPEKIKQMNKVTDRLFKNYRSNRPKRLSSQTKQNIKNQKYVNSLSKKIIPPLVKFSASTTKLHNQMSQRGHGGHRDGSTNVSASSSFNEFTSHTRHNLEEAIHGNGTHRKDANRHRETLVLPKVGSLQRMNMEESLPTRQSGINVAEPFGERNLPFGTRPSNRIGFSSSLPGSTSQKNHIKPWITPPILPHIQTRYKVTKCDYEYG
jgi:hypothetical protein